MTWLFVTSMSKRKTKKFGDKHKVVFLDIDGVLNSLDLVLIEKSMDIIMQ